MIKYNFKNKKINFITKYWLYIYTHTYFDKSKIIKNWANEKNLQI